MTATRVAAAPSHAARAIADQRKHALAHLSAVKAQHGHLPGVVMAEVAERLGVHPEHLRRMLRQFDQTQTVSVRPGNTYKKCVLDERKAHVQFFLSRGVASKAYTALQSTGDLPADMSLRAFQRRVSEWDPALLACAKGGYRAMVKHQFFNVEHIPYKGHAYGTDHTKLPIMVVPDRGIEADLALVDHADRPQDPGGVGLLADRSHAEQRRQHRHPPRRQSRGWVHRGRLFVGGKPEFLRSDRGGDYISDALALNLLDLDIGRQFTEPYSSWQNGRVERLNGTIDRDFAPSIPGFHPGGEDQYTRRVLKTPVPVSSLVTLETLDRRLGGFFGDYNNRPHSVPQRHEPARGVGGRRARTSPPLTRTSSSMP